MIKPIDWVNILQKERDIEISYIKWEIPVLITLLIPLFIGIVITIVELRFEASAVCFPILWLVVAILICLVATAYPIILYLDTIKNIKKYNELIRIILTNEKINSSEIYNEYKDKFPNPKQIEKNGKKGDLNQTSNIN